MENQNTAGAPTQQVTTKSLFNSESVKKKFEEMLGKKAQGFIVSVLQIVNSNNLLMKCDPMSIYNAACLAATLDLPINNSLGFAYIIPFGDKATFQLGYRGYVQLAQRSGQFKTISATPIYEGQLIESNPLTGFKFDFSKQDSQTVIGYAGYFELINGFQKTLYMPIDKVKAHGSKYSQTFKKGFGLWKDDFDAMATKTVLKLLLSKFAPLSVEMQKAVLADQSTVNNEEATDFTYVDNLEVKKTQEEIEQERINHLINDCTSVQELEDLQLLHDNIDWSITNFDVKKAELKKKK